MTGSFTWRRLPLFFFAQIPLWAVLISQQARKGGWGWVAFWAPFLLFIALAARIRVTADEQGVLVVGLIRARRFSWDQIDWIGRVDRGPDYRLEDGRSARLMAVFRASASGAPQLHLRNGRSIRLLAVHKHLSRNQEDPVVRLSAMLAEHHGTLAQDTGVSVASLSVRPIEQHRPSLRLPRRQQRLLAAAVTASLFFFVALLGVLLHDGGHLEGSDWVAVPLCLLGVVATAFLAFRLVTKGREFRR